jgi:hypothetical protein
LRCCYNAIGLKMRLMAEAVPLRDTTSCWHLLQLLAICPSDNVPWSLFDGGANLEALVLHRGARVELYGFVKATANNGRRGRVMEVHKDTSVSVVFGCNYGALSCVKPGVEIQRFKMANIRMMGPLGAHEELLRLMPSTTPLSSTPPPPPPLPPTPPSPPPRPVSDMDPVVHDAKELKRIAAHLKAVMPTLVQVDDVRRTFSMHGIVAGFITHVFGTQTDRMRALLHARCGYFMDEEHAHPKLRKTVLEITCVAAELVVTCRRLGRLEGEGWGSAMLLKIFGTARYAWGEDSLVTKRCLTLCHALLVADICQQHLVVNDVLQSSVEEICNLPSIRELLDVCVGPFSFVRCVRTYLGTELSNLTNPYPNLLKCVSWRYRILRATVDLDENTLKQISDTMRDADPALHWDLSIIQMDALFAAAQRSSMHGLAERSVRLYEQALELGMKLLGSENPQTKYLQLHLQKQQKRLAGGSAGAALENSLKNENIAVSDAVSRFVRGGHLLNAPNFE